MTDSPSAVSSRQATRSRSPAALVWSATATFLVVLLVLSIRVSDGRDPALRLRRGAGPAPRRVLIRRIYERRVIVRLAPNAPARSPQSSQQVGAAGAYPPLLTRTS